MSGMKRADVQMVLSNMAELRRSRFQRALLTLTQDLEESRSMRGIHQAVEGLPAALQQKLSAMWETVSEAHSAQLQELAQELESIQSSTDALHRKTERLQARVRSKVGDHFFDAEYQEARQIETQYEQVLSDRIEPLSRRLQEARRKAEQRLAREAADAQEQMRVAAAAEIGALRRHMEGARYRHPLRLHEQLTARDFCSGLLGREEDYVAIEQALGQAERALSVGDYEPCQLLTQRATEQWRALIADMDAQEGMLADQVATAAAIRDALKAAGNTVETVFVDGELRNGIRIRTTKGAGPVDFTVAPGDTERSAGEAARGTTRVDFNVDGLGGDCGEHVEALRQKLGAAGIRFVPLGLEDGDDTTCRRKRKAPGTGRQTSPGGV